MYTIFITTTITILALYFGAKKFFKKDLTGELIVGFFLGLFWEILTNESWNYDTTRMITFFIGKAEIPLEILMGWSLVLAASILTTEIMQKKFKWHGKLSFFVLGLISIFALGFATEIIGVNTGMWTYPDNRGVYQVGSLILPIRVVGGWFYFGIIFLTVIKFYEHALEKNLELDFTKLTKKFVSRLRRR